MEYIKRGPTKMADSERYARISDIIDLAVDLMTERSSSGITLKEIMKEYGCARSTAERMRNCLKYSRLEIDELYTDGKGEIHWGIPTIQPYMKNFIPITTDDIANLKLAKKSLPQKSKVALNETISKLEAICKCKKTSIEDEIDSIMRTEYVVNKQKSKVNIDLEVLRRVTDAIRSANKIKAKYKGEERVLCPLGLISKDKTYLVARRDDSDMVLNYSLHKLSDVHVMYQPFDRKGFDLKEYSNRSFGAYQEEPMNVEVVFKKEVAEDALAYNFHPTQKFTQNKDGSLNLKFTAGSKYEIIWHLFTWGDNVKIIAPKELKKAYNDYLEKVLKSNK